jgi:competence protein ComEA
VNTLRKWIRNAFGFSGREVNGFVILLPLALVIVLAQPLYHLWLIDRHQDFAQERNTLDSLITLWGNETTDTAKIAAPSLFAFDPNKASAEELRALGFSEILSTRMASYRQKGGQFRVKADLLKIYGLDSSFYFRLYTYITLPEKKKNERTFRDRDSLVKNHRKPHIVNTFDLNLADTAQLKKVYGIGPVLALRIVRFREKLGGFVKREQLNEVYGLDSAVVKRLFEITFIAPGYNPEKMNMNVADEKKLSAHPYIKRSMAGAIVAYRFQHGNFIHVDDLRKLSLLKQEDIDKILPYLTVND